MEKQSCLLRGGLGVHQAEDVGLASTALADAAQRAIQADLFPGRRHAAVRRPHVIAEACPNVCRPSRSPSDASGLRSPYPVHVLVLGCAPQSCGLTKSFCALRKDCNINRRCQRDATIQQEPSAITKNHTC